MRSVLVASAALVGLLLADRAGAGEIQSGIPVGGAIGAYSTTKCAGAEDGVAVGTSLCYTCRLGARPVAFLFAKAPSDALARVAKELDKLVGQNSSKQMAAVLNFTGEATDDYLKQIKQFAEEAGLKNIAVTVTADVDQFKVSDDAALTVMHYRDKVVRFNLAVDDEGLKDPQVVQKILQGAREILK